MQNQEILVPHNSNFDLDKVIVVEPETHTFTKGSSIIKWTTLNVYDLGENDSKLPIYFELAEQKLWGVFGIWPFGTPKEGQSNDKLEGFQIFILSRQQKQLVNQQEPRRKHFMSLI